MGLATHLYAGFTGGLVSSVVLQPLDLAKTRLQQGKGSSHEAWRALFSEAVERGPFALWRGTLPSALRMSIGASLYLTTLGRLRDTVAAVMYGDRSTRLSNARATSVLPSLPMAVNLALGAGARTCVGFVTMPLTILKARYESSLYNYKSMGAAWTDIISEPKGWRNLFSGFSATALRDAPYAGLYVLGYEQAKDVFGAAVPNLPSAVINASAAVTASVAASALTAPFDTVKTRMQIAPGEYSSLSKAARLVYQKGGVRSFFDGLGLRLVRKALSSGIAWCIYEEIIRYNSRKA